MANLTFDFLHNYVTGERRASDPADAYQYDEGRVLEAVVPVAVASCEIQYWIRGMEKADAYTPTSITQNTDNTYTILGNIPNSYFETNGDLRVYIVVTDGDASITTYEGYIHIKERQMPEDYVDDDPDNEAVRVIAEARAAAATATEKAGEAAASAEQAQEILDSIPEDYSQLSEDVSDLKDDVNTSNVSAEHNIAYHINTDSVTKSGVTVTYSPSSIKASGTATALDSIILSNIFMLPKGEYLFTDGISSHSEDFNLALAKESGVEIARATKTHVITISEDTKVKFCVVFYANKSIDIEMTPVLYPYDFVKSNAHLTNCLFERSNNLVDKNRFIRNAFISNTGTSGVSTTYFYTEKIPVVAGSEISFSASRFIAYYNGDTFVSGLNNPSSPQTIPNGVDYAILTGYTSNIDAYMVNTGATLRPYADYIIQKTFEVTSTSARKIVVFGDSWTDIVNTTWTRWPVLINALDEYDVTSYGVTGSTISGHVADQVNSFLGASATADVFIMMGGINDYRGGVANTSIISAVQGYYTSLHEAYPNARFIYLANNQLYYTAHQLKYFNTIVEQLNISGIEAYPMFAWASPSQYADDFIHLGNAGNQCLANNILKLLRGGEIKTLVNRLHWDIMNDQNARIGQMNIYEFYENGYPRIEIKGVASGALANKTTTKTINTKTFYTSAPWAVFPYATDNFNNRVRIYSPQTETLDSNNQVTTFDLTLVTTNTGFVFTTSANGFVFEN